MIERPTLYIHRGTESGKNLHSNVYRRYTVCMWSNSLPGTLHYIYKEKFAKTLILCMHMYNRVRRIHILNMYIN
jgi:hypothetical protein